MKSKQEETRALLETEKHSLHYPDYEYSYGVVSLLNGTTPEQKIVIAFRYVPAAGSRMTIPTP